MGESSEGRCENGQGLAAAPRVGKFWCAGHSTALFPEALAYELGRLRVMTGRKREREEGGRERSGHGRSQPALPHVMTHHHCNSQPGAAANGAVDSDPWRCRTSLPLPYYSSERLSSTLDPPSPQLTGQSRQGWRCRSPGGSSSLETLMPLPIPSRRHSVPHNFPPSGDALLSGTHSPTCSLRPQP